MVNRKITITLCAFITLLASQTLLGQTDLLRSELPTLDPSEAERDISQQNDSHGGEPQDSALVQGMDDYEIYDLENRIYRIIRGRIRTNPELARATLGLSEDELADLYAATVEIEDDIADMTKQRIADMCSHWRSQAGVLSETARGENALDFYDNYRLTESQLLASRNQSKERIASRMGESGLRKVEAVVQRFRSTLASSNQVSWSDRVRSVGKVSGQLAFTCGGA